MNSKLQKELTAKYREFFQHLERHNTPMIDPDKNIIGEFEKLRTQESIVVPMQFGFEVGDGWYMLLDELMGDIQNHVENENRNRKHRVRSKFAQWLDTKRHRLPWKWKMLRNLILWVVNRFPRGVDPMPPIQIDQIKEKFGGLRFYFSGGDDYIYGMVSFAESLSYQICETCGTTIGVGQTKGWIHTICYHCHEKNDRAKDLQWKPIRKDVVKEAQNNLNKNLDKDG